MESDSGGVTAYPSVAPPYLSDGLLVRPKRISIANSKQPRWSPRANEIKHADIISPLFKLTPPPARPTVLSLTLHRPEWEFICVRGVCLCAHAN